LNNFDAKETNGESGERKPPQANEAGNYQFAPLPCMLEYLRRIPLCHKDSRRIHLAPAIPSRKLNNAIASRSIFKTRQPDQCLLLLDDTIFEGGADGLLITDEFISFKDLFSDSCDFHYGLIWNGRFSLDGTSLQVFGETSKRFAQISRATLEILISTLNQFFDDRLAWCRIAATQGHVQAQFSLSMSIHETSQKQMSWLTLAAENGHVAAQHNLGMHFRHTNPELAFQWFSRAAKSGSKLAAERLQSDIFRKFANFNQE
jgi:hypothetical protein